MDVAEAVKWYHKAAEQGYARSQNYLGGCYYNGHGVEQDYAEAVKWYRKAAEQGNTDAQFDLGWCYDNGHGVEQDYAEAIKWYRKAAEQGDAAALCKLGWCYENGKGVEQDYAEAVKWYRKAEEVEECLHNIKADIGWCYAYGLANWDEAGRYYQEVKEEIDYQNAFDYMENEWYHGGCIPHPEENVNLYFELAEQGNYRAMFWLGVCYRDGLGVNIDQEESLRWFHKAAENGDSESCGHLGLCFEKGEYVEQDFEVALKWYQRAVDNGDAKTCVHIGQCYEKGVIVSQDYKEALKWYRRALELGEIDTLIELRRMLDNMNKITTPYYLFFDTETTGVPIDYNAPASNTWNWPRLVQLGWIVTDEGGNVLSQGNEIVKPEGFVIPADAARVLGITTEKAQRDGKPLSEVIEAFLKDAEQTKCIVGHNISFDQKVVGAELYRLGIPDTISTAKSICTMEAGANYCKIPGYMGYKWPKLQELHNKLFGCNFEDAHDAMADITATKKCFFEMRKRGLI